MRRLARSAPLTSRALGAAHDGGGRSASAPRQAGPGRGARGLVLVTLAATLLACPEERPGAAKEVPPQRVPPAMSLDAAPAAERAVAPALPGAPPIAAPGAGDPAAASPAAPPPAPAAPARRR